MGALGEPSDFCSQSRDSYFFPNCAGRRRAAPTRAAFASDQSSSSHAEFKLRIDRVSGAFFLPGTLIPSQPREVTNVLCPSKEDRLCSLSHGGCETKEPRGLSPWHGLPGRRVTAFLGHTA